MVEAVGRRLSGSAQAAVEQLDRAGVRRLLVLGRGRGACALLQSRGVDVVSVDGDAGAEGFGLPFFRGLPSSRVVVEDAAAYVGRAIPASFDAVLVDFQDSSLTPPAYLSSEFWVMVAGLLRLPAIILIHVLAELRVGNDWPRFQLALGAIDLPSFALSEAFAGKDRLLVSRCPR
jgi:hypothetical protein